MLGSVGVIVLLYIVSMSNTLAGSFNGVNWVRDYSNSPVQDKSGSGITPSTSGATNNLGTYTFKISSSSTSSTQRQEWKYERRAGYMKMDLFFQLDTSTSNFDKIGVAQNHDDGTGSSGVFSIYQVRKNGSNWVFGVQGDTTDASNSYSNFDTETISLGKWYRLVIRSYVAETGAFEIAQLRDGTTDELLWQEQVEGGGDSQGYYKVGAYKLTGGYGPIAINYKNITFYTGTL